VAPVVIGSLPMEKALRGKIRGSGSFLACGDAFLPVDFGI
jgi:hypothetical protein